jgi:hypothetical protein
MFHKSLLVVCMSAMSGAAFADCPLYPGRAPQPVLATAQTRGAEVRHIGSHKLTTSMPVPVHVDLEVRVVLSEIPDEERSGMVGAVNQIAAWIEGGTTSEIKERFGVDATATAHVEFQELPEGLSVLPPQEEARLRSEGFRPAKEGTFEHEGRSIKSTVWVRGTPRMETRTVSANAVRSRALVRITARVCVDDREGVLGFAPKVSVIDMGADVHPDAQVTEADKDARHAEFLRQAQEEANRLTQWLRQHLHRVSGEQRTAMRARTGETFTVAVPFVFLDKADELPVEVTSLTAPVLNEAF